MKVLAIGMFVVLSAWAAGGPDGAETRDTRKYGGHGYGYFALGNPFDYSGKGGAFGGGGEGFLSRGWSLGGDISYLYPLGEPSDGVGLASVSSGYHFRKGQRLMPFVLGGYTLGFRSGVGHLFHYGGGVTYWFSRRVGARIELRDHRLFEYPRDSLLTLRFGVSFR